MAKGRRDARQKAGEELLRDWGVGDDPASLEQAFGRDEAADLAIAARLGAIADRSSVEALQRLESSAGKEARKEIKRSLYRLEQRGVEVPRKTEPVRTYDLASPIEGYVSAFDGRGDRLVWLVKPSTGGVLHLFAVVNDPLGLHEVALNRLTRKGLREIRKELEDKHDIRFVPVDWRRADAILQQAVEWARRREQSVQGDYTSLRSHLTSEAAEPAAQSAPPELPDCGVQDLASSEEILVEPEMRTWLLDDEKARAAIGELQRVRDSPLVLNEMQRKERFAEVYDRLVDETFGAEATESWARRLEEMAHYFGQTDRPQRAAQSTAAARALRAGTPAKDIPFCQVYVHRTMALYLEQEEERQEEERRSSLIVTPDQLRDQQKRGG